MTSIFPEILQVALQRTKSAGTSYWDGKVHTMVHAARIPASPHVLDLLLLPEPCGPSTTMPICTPGLEMVLKDLQSTAISSKMAKLNRDGALTHTFHPSHVRLVTATLVLC